MKLPYRDAIVGSTGFVGGNLLASHKFSGSYHSDDISTIAGEHFDLVVFSAARAEKWRANKDPSADREHILDLERVLKSFSARQLVLISTVDVYGSPIVVDEDTPIVEEGLHPYGRHRLGLERFVRSTFDEVLVVRLPGLFGAGIKKNVIFDLLNNNNIERIDHRSVFQYYNLRRLWSDVLIALDAGLGLVNLVSDPISTHRLARECFGLHFDNVPADSVPVRYDVRSKHAGRFGGRSQYQYSDRDVIRELREFIRVERGG